LPAYRDTLKLADDVRTLGVTVFVTVGPYPVDYLRLREKFGRMRAMEIMKRGVDEAGRLCEEGLCIGIGEIGRPHFMVEEGVIQDSNEILAYSMKVAAEIKTTVVLHTESATPEQCKALADMAKKVGLSPQRVVKHFSPPLILPEENHGIFPSLLSTDKNVTVALKKGDRFLMETDYIDDLQRPGAVLSPRTVPRRTKKFLETGVMTPEQAYRIHVENPEKVYALALSE